MTRRDGQTWDLGTKGHELQLFVSSKHCPTHRRGKRRFDTVHATVCLCCGQLDEWHEYEESSLEHEAGCRRIA